MLASRLLAAAALPLLAACITLTTDPRALTWQPTGIILAQRCPVPLHCSWRVPHDLPLPWAGPMPSTRRRSAS